MPGNTDAAELEAYGNIDIFEGLYEYLILEVIGVAFTLTAFALIVYAATKLIRANDVPGARLIASSIVLTILFALISASYTILLGIEENVMAEAILNIVLGIVFFIGSLGFLRLCKFAVNAGA